MAFTLGNIFILPWYVPYLSIRFTQLNPSRGRAYNIFNIKWVFLLCVVLFEIGSVLCGAAPNMTALIIGRVIGGIGGSGTYCGGLMYISIITNEHERPLYLSGIIAMWGLGR